MASMVPVNIILDLISADGFEEIRCSGQHHIYSRDDGTKPITISWAKKSDEIPMGTANNIVKDAGPNIEKAFDDIVKKGGGKKALKRHCKALKRGLDI